MRIKVNTKSQNYFRYGSGIHFIKSYLPKKKSYLPKKKSYLPKKKSYLPKILLT